MTDTTALPPSDLPPSGGSTPGSSGSTDEPLFVRPAEGRMLAGVCAGIARRWAIDLTLVRIVAVAVAIASGIGVAAYVAAWLLTPSSDGPAPIGPGTSLWRAGRRLPTAVVVVLGALLLVALGHALTWGAAPGLGAGLGAALSGSLGFVVAAVLLFVLMRARWLRVLVAVLLAVLLLVVGSVAAFGDRLGSRTFHVTSASDLRSSYDFGAGTVDLDLSALRVTGDEATHVRLGRGTVRVTVPADTDVVVHARAGLGSVRVAGHESSGIDAEQIQQLSAPGSRAGRLLLDVTVGAGRAEISRAR
jgi:phage shock protein PspC (stress-responsive transcriptional regulator)